ncbi:preprotein translocase subunit SecA [Kandleria vitulina]|uniref:Protein translocase subunit SecA n=1 Tax=Kandleria vitulina TaxID=1630 RepID=A0A1H2QAJ1_9FIRM|nr:preprotein translocase subunit SecA [Kandleria vitulina]SDW03439.1 preprotein translocase subunit SecA [Kandleria vitulina]HAD23119.1 preprotein translocase subunit SecA [Kandleria vitulina]HAH74669.1 preprotein translocase subunit SecA [Kandleria vitulina]HBG67072.1 preprotein translocase subunit SecA [Kandleria vitulina]HCY53486.1 preprotein translocase subunit SecA [Kandleria vitulina]
MPKKKKEIKKQVKKRLKKEGEEHQDLNLDAKIVDLGDHRGDDIVVDTFDDVKLDAKPLPFSTKPQKDKKGFGAKLKSLFSQDNAILRKLNKQAEEILALEPQVQVMSDEELAAQTEFFKERLEKGETLDDILVEAFAVAREAAWRVLGLKAFKVQLMGGISLHNGDIAEMKTGEGKTLTSIFPVYLNALEGKGVHVITVNEYLARRDCEENGRVFKFLGLTVGLNERELDSDDKRRMHACDVTYTTNSELGFDYLRDNMVTSYDEKVLRPLHYALIDEVDSILIDESRTPLIISGGKKHTAAMYVSADKFVKKLTKDKDYEVDVESKSVTLTPDGITKAEKAFKVDNLFDPSNTALVHYINNALKANYTMTLNVEYMIATEDGSHDIRNAQIMIIDQFTGRVMPGRAYSDGLHQAIEAKEGVPIKEETVTLATITYQNFFRLFDKLAGMTGTAKTEEEEFRLIYNMRVIEIPTNKPVIREDKPDLVFSSKSAKYKAICEEVEKRHAYGQPILLGTVAVETSEVLSSMLRKRGIRHNVLNAKNHAKEAAIIEKAGVKGAVTIATNMAGRGTDIKLGEGVAEIGGLMVIGSERHESRRIDNQLRGRSGRQGDPGCSQFFVSFEDELMQRFANEKVKTFTDAFLEDDAIESRMVTRSIEAAQKRVEGQNFDIRKQLLEYDDIMRQQREIMYKERDDIMQSDDLKDIVKGMFKSAIELDVARFTKEDGKKPVVDMDGLLDYVGKNYMLLTTLKGKNADTVKNEPKKVEAALSEIVAMQYDNRFNKDLPLAVRTDYERRVLLGIIDHSWINHIDAMSKLRNGIYLRAYAQRDPLQEYTEEGFYMFEEMTKSISQEIAKTIVHMGIRPGTEMEQNIPEITVEVEFKEEEESK